MIKKLSLAALSAMPIASVVGGETAFAFFQPDNSPVTGALFQGLLALNFAVLIAVAGMAVKARLAAEGGKNAGRIWPELGWGVAPAFLMVYVAMTYA